MIALVTSRLPQSPGVYKEDAGLSANTQKRHQVVVQLQVSNRNGPPFEMCWLQHNKAQPLLCSLFSVCITFFQASCDQRKYKELYSAVPSLQPFSPSNSQ